METDVCGEITVVGVNRGDLYEVKLGNARFEVGSLPLRECARILDVRDEVVDLAFLRAPLQ